MSPSRAILVTLFVLASSAARAALVQQTFDSVSQFDLGYWSQSVTGVLANTTTPTTINFQDNHVILSRCVPLFLTMTEKPGRYYLNLTLDGLATPYPALMSCGLQLKN